jgi:methyltransferase (TIGR00027 family)
MSQPERAASTTALGVAALRAYHQRHDPPPRILDDPISARLFDGPGGMRDETPALRALRTSVVLRSRFAEDCLAEAVTRGVAQYVVLGAGFDTFAYRQPAWARGLRIFEVDHPRSQSAKRARLDAAGISLPPNLEFVSADFERQSLRDALTASSLDFANAAAFSCLGVLVYLEWSAIEALFRTVGAFPRGSELVFTYSPRRDSPFEARAAALGEPWLSHHEPGELAPLLERCGFRRVEFLEPETARQHYFRDAAPGGLAAPQRVSIARATV